MPDADLNGNSNGESHSHALFYLSSKVEYALLALLELASSSTGHEPLTISQIAAKQPVPERYLEQILTNLRRGGVVHSQRGARGGYTLVREPWQITLLEVVRLVQGDRREKNSSESCTVEQELIHGVWHQSSVAFEAILNQCTLQDLCQKRDAQKQKYPMYYI
jgi:Rrf2 family protein